LIQTGQGILLGLGDVLQEAADVAGREVAGVTFVVKEDQTTRPVGGALTGTVLPEACQGHLADQVEQTRRLMGGQGGQRFAGHDVSPRAGGQSLEERVSTRTETEARKKIAENSCDSA
jgi:hypothetical protein